MFYRLKATLLKTNFYRKTSGILRTPPMPLIDAPWRIVSMVSNSDTQMYIGALKSLYRRLGAGKVTAIVARDFPSSGMSALRYHFPGIDLVALDEIHTGQCQRGGTWERLLHLIDHSQKTYAIQLDADTLAFGDISEVLHCVHNNSAFTLSGSTGPHKSLRKIDEISPMADVIENARQFNSNYIGIVAERRFDEFAGHERFRYVRGSSAFVGPSARWCKPRTGRTLSPRG